MAIETATVLAILALVQVIVKLFGPVVAQLWQGQAESIRAKNPHAADAMTTVGLVFGAVTAELETFPTGTLTKDELNHTRRATAIKEGTARLLARGLAIDEGDARLAIEQALKARDVLAGGKKAAMDAPVPIGATS